MGEKWVGRTAPELASEASTPTGLYCWLRASGKTAEQAIEEIAQRSGFTASYNISRLAGQCARAEEAERTRATAPAADTSFHAEGLMYRSLRARGGSRREALEHTAVHFGHGRANRKPLEARLAEVEQELAKGRPPVDVDAVANDATNRLAELEAARVRLARGALVDSEVRAEFRQVEREIASCKETLELVKLAQSAPPEKQAA